MTEKKKQQAPDRTGVEKFLSGIPGLDRVMEGGLPRCRTVLVSGETGCGKTILLHEFLYRGLHDHGEPGVFVTFEEHPDEMLANVANFKWDYEQYYRDGKLLFADFSPSHDREIETAGSYELDPVVARILSAVQKIGAKRVAIDNIGMLFSRFEDIGEIRRILFLLSDRLKEAGISTLFTAEIEEGSSQLSRHGFMEFVADGVIVLRTHVGQNQMSRSLQVRKMRGIDYRTGTVEYDISDKGMRIFPKIPVDLSVASTDFHVRRSFGVPALDEALGGGIPQGHMLLVTGNTGTGKTTLGMQFLQQGIGDGENVVWVAMEEPVPQVLKTAAAHGWDFETLVRQGRLSFVTCSLLDLSPDRLLYQIVDTVEAVGANRVVFDSVSSLESSIMSKERVREFLIQLTVYLKTRGTNCIMNYLSAESFQASSGNLLSSMATNEMRLSSIVDGIIMLRYVEREQTVMKLLNILKLRGSVHAKDIFRYEIDTGGIRLGERFNF